jgi:hypothetical protein
MAAGYARVFSTLAADEKLAVDEKSGKHTMPTTTGRSDERLYQMEAGYSSTVQRIQTSTMICKRRAHCSTQQTQNELRGSKFQPHRGRCHYKGAWKKWAFHCHQFQPHRGRRHYKGAWKKLAFHPHQFQPHRGGCHYEGAWKGEADYNNLKRGSREDGSESSCRDSRPLRPGGPSRLAPAQQTQNELRGSKFRGRTSRRRGEATQVYAQVGLPAYA